MSRRRKAIVPLVWVAMIIGAWWLWPRNVYTYQGKTVEEWFRDFAETIESAVTSFASPRHRKAREAFQEMGTNAVPFLARRLNRNPDPSLLERLASKLPARFQPVPRWQESRCALLLLTDLQPPRSMLEELLKPALLSTNQMQRRRAEFITREANGESPPTTPSAP